jgi:N-acetylmuramoyl-L-alanine amidase
MRPINKIIIHCSDSSFGDAAEIRRWHMEPPRNWSDIGYHFVVLNGARKNDTFDASEDGVVELGRPVDQIGSHCLGDNKDSVGICLVGIKIFSERQLAAAATLVRELRERYNPVALIYGHCEMPSGKKQGKSCPNLDMNLFRQRVADITKGAPNG